MVGIKYMRSVYLSIKYNILKKEKFPMKMKKIISCVAAMAAMSAMAVSVSAADWSQASYADNDPTTCKVLSSDGDGCTFTNSATQPDMAKLRITLDKVLKNRDDYAKIAKMEWTVTYSNVPSDLTVPSMAGGTYVTNTNSRQYKFEADEYDEATDTGTWKSSEYVTTDGIEVENPLEKDGELVFMDWSFAGLGEYGITYRISDLKIWDKDGSEIEQLGYKEWTEDMSADAPVVEEPVADEPVAPTESQPASDNIIVEDNAQTGNVSAGIAVAVLALATASAITAGRKMKK